MPARPPTTLSEPALSPPIEPRQLPELRAALVRALASDFMTFTWRLHAARGWLVSPRQELVPMDGADGARRAERARLAAASLFAVSEQMTDLVTAAEASLPRYRLHPDDVPAPTGFCLFGRPVGTASEGEGMVAVSWEVSAEGVAIAWYLQLLPGGIARMAAHVRGYFPMAVTYSRIPAFLPFGEAGPIAEEVARIDVPEVDTADPRTQEAIQRLIREFGLPADPLAEHAPDPRVVSWDGVGEFRKVLAVLLTTWLVMGEPYIRAEMLHTDRASRRRLERAGEVDVPPVRLLTLRRPAATSGSSDGPSRYHHQWVVSGHWRRQWYPSRQEHRPRWIAEHLSGPEGAPLLGGERVRVLRR